ncbi:MAG: hypothetical protein Q9207_005308 [Kuettlingeria erythrocarpa]
MPVLEANSEAFLSFFKGLQKGKGKENASLESSEALSEPKFTADDWKSSSTVTKNFSAASEALEEPATNEGAENVGTFGTSPDSQEPESEGKSNNFGFEKSGAGSPGLAENAAAHAAYVHISINTPTATNSPANGTPGDGKPTAVASESFAPPATAAEPPVNNEANYYATTSNDPTVSGLQIITRSMTASGGDTTLANTSAATEKAATPEVSTPRAEAWPRGLVSSGSEFLKALPKASDAFEARMRGGVNIMEEENDLTTPISAAFANDHGIATYANGFHHSPEASLSSFREYALPNPEEKDFSEMWGVNNTSRDPADLTDKLASFTNASYTRQPNTGRVKGSSRFYSRGVRYTEAELLEIGLQNKLGLLEKLIELKGTGRVRVGISLDWRFRWSESAV